MTKCLLCQQQIVDGQDLNDTSQHTVCYKEWSRRHLASLCTYCGRDYKHDPDQVLDGPCDDCKFGGKYLDYPGPQ